MAIFWFIAILLITIALPLFLIFGKYSLIVSLSYIAYMGFREHPSSYKNNQHQKELAPKDSPVMNLINSKLKELDISMNIDFIISENDECDNAFAMNVSIFSSNYEIHFNKNFARVLNELDVNAEGVVMHEVGHLVYRHNYIQRAFSDARYFYNTIFTFVSLIAFVFFPVLWLLNKILDIFEMLLSRTHEYQADEFSASCANPLDVVDFLEAIKKLFPPQGQSFLARVFATHPTDQQRIDNIKNKFKV